MDDAGATDYRLAPAFAVRLLGLGLLVLAVLVLVTAGVVTAAGGPLDVVVVVAAVGLLAVLATAAWLRSRAYVVRLTAEGYHVRFVRGAGVTRGRWDQVREAATATPRGVPCVVLHRHDGATTSIPVGVLAVDRERFADDVRTRLVAADRRT